jgi:hypothetical protein
MRHLRLLYVFGLIWVLAVPTAWAFEAPANGYSASQEQLREIKRSQLGPMLGVDQRTVDQLLGVEQRYKPALQQLRQDMINDFMRLQQLMRQPAPPEPEVRASLENLKRKRLETLNLQERQKDEEMALLTSVQQARYVIYLMGLRQQITKEARSLRGPSGPQPLTPKGPREIPVVRPTP